MRLCLPYRILFFDLAGRFTYANQPLLDLWQKPFAEVVGKTFELDYPTDLAARLQQQIQQLITTRQPLKDETLYTHLAPEPTSIFSCRCLVQMAQ